MTLTLGSSLIGCSVLYTEKSLASAKWYLGEDCMVDSLRISCHQRRSCCFRQTRILLRRLIPILSRYLSMELFLLLRTWYRHILVFVLLVDDCWQVSQLRSFVCIFSLKVTSRFSGTVRGKFISCCWMCCRTWLSKSCGSRSCSGTEGSASKSFGFIFSRSSTSC